MLKYFLGFLFMIALSGFYWYEAAAPVLTEPVSAGTNPQNATYEIAGASVTLTDGKSMVENSPTSETITAYFGNEAKGDLDGDGDEDRAFIVIQNGGGSGTFVYVVAALQEERGYSGTNGILLGDRVAPQTTEIRDGLILVNYADRKPDEPIIAQPSIGVTLRARVENRRLVQQAD